MSCLTTQALKDFLADLQTFNSAITDADALAAYDIYNSDNNLENQIPPIDKALEILNDLTTYEKDEQLARSTETFKLKKLDEQNELIATIFEGGYANENQIGTLNKILDMTANHMEFLNNAINSGVKTRTISVSRFIGNSKFKGDPAEYEAFKLFGTFIHDILENLQKEAIQKDNISSRKILTREKFNGYLTKYRENNPFRIENLDDDKLYVMTEDLVNHIATLKSAGYLILPEISIIGVDINGTRIIGRIDMLLIDPKGDVKIYDFKTKKVQLLDEGGDWQKDNAEATLAWLALKTHEMSKEEGTQDGFVTGEFSRRSAYDTWAMQVNVYKNILEQNGIDVEGHSILALLYETDKDKNFLGSIVHEFLLENYYIYADNDSQLDSDGVSIIKKRKLDQRIARVKTIVDKIITGKVSTKTEKVKATKLLHEVLQPSDQEYEKMRTNIKSLIDKQLVEVNTKLYNKSTAVAIKNVLQERKTTLVKYNEVLSKMNDEDFDRSVNFAIVMDELTSELTFLNEKAEELHTKFKSNPEKFNKTDLSKIDLLFKNSESLNDILLIMQRVLNEARDQDENNITVISPAVNAMGTILGFKENIRTIKSEIMRQKAVTKVLMTPGEKKFGRINSQLTELLSKEKEILEQEIVDLQAGKSLSFYQSIKSAALSVVSNTYKQRLAERLDPSSPRLALIEEKEKAISIINNLLNGAFDYSEEGVLAYLDNITNPDSTFYVGSDRVLPYSMILSGLATNQWVASIANKDLGIASVTEMLKNSAALAVKNAQNDFASSNFDKVRNKLYQKGMSFEQINAIITDRVTVKYKDRTTGEDKEKTQLSLVTPYTQEYKEKWFSYKDELREYKAEIRTLKSSRTKANFKEVNEQIKQVENRRSLKVKEFTNWMIDNCSLPYVNEFYTLQRDLPREIAENLQDLYLELETYHYFENMKGIGEEAIDDLDVMTPFDFERIGEIEDEIRGLREKAKEIDPAYADYIDKMQDYFEFNVDLNKFEREKALAMSRFEDNEEAKTKWLDENQITRPTQQWYERLNELYDELAYIYGDDPVLQDLFEARNKILRKHKAPGGIFKAQYMSDQDIEDYDQIEMELEAYLDGKKGVQLNDEEQDFVNDIHSQLAALKQRDKSEYYTRQFDMRYNDLEAKLDLISSHKALISSLVTQEEKADDVNNAKKLLVAYETQFLQAEEEFRTWYNKNHNNKYKSILTGYKIKSFADPKSFNYQTLPAKEVQDIYLETVPHPKFTVKRVKQDAFYLDGEKLDDEQREEMNNDPAVRDALIMEGRLQIEKGLANPNYLLTPDGIPMPKNIIKTGDHTYAPASLDTTNINQRYLDLFNNPEVFEFYNTLSNMFFRLQEKTDGRTLGYTIPGNTSSVVESLHMHGLGDAIKKQKDIFVDKHIRAYGSAQDLNDNVFGDLTNSIRLRGNNQFDELLQSEDSVSSIMKWCAEAHYNIAMQETLPYADGFIDELKAKAFELQEKIQKNDKGIIRDIDGKIINSLDFEKRLKELNAVIQHAEYERNKFVYGKYEDPYSVSRAVTKRLNAFFRYTSFIRIGYDVTNQAKNYVAGSIQAMIAACELGGGHYGKRDYLWAKNKIFGFNGVMGHYLKDLGNISDISDDTMLYRLFNPVQKEFSKYVTDMSGKVSRKALDKLLSVNELGFFLQDKGDTLIGMTVLWSVLHNYKYAHKTETDSTGKPVMYSAHDAYQRNANNELVFRPDIEYTQEDENMLRNIVYSEMRRAQGNYAKADQVKAESTAMGKMMLFFRKYLVPMFMNRFGYMKTNWEAGEVSLGYWRAVGLAIRQYGPMQTAKHLLVGGKTLNRMNANTMGTFVTAKVNQARRDALTMILLTMASMMALAWLKRKKQDDDEYEPGVLTGNLLRLLWQTKGETTSMFPVGEGSSEYIKNFTTGIPFVREFTAATKAINHTYNWTAVNIAANGEEPDPDFDSQWYQQAWQNAYYARKYGTYEKGDSKLLKDFVDLTGIRNVRDLFEPTNRIQVLEQKQ